MRVFWLYGGEAAYSFPQTIELDSPLSVCKMEEGHKWDGLLPLSKIIVGTVNQEDIVEDHGHWLTVNKLFATHECTCDSEEIKPFIDFLIVPCLQIPTKMLPLPLSPEFLERDS